MMSWISMASGRALCKIVLKAAGFSWTRSTFHKTVYFHKKKESYEAADNKATMVDDGDDGVLDVLDASVLLSSEFLHDHEPADLYRAAREQYVPT